MRTWWILLVGGLALAGSQPSRAQRRLARPLALPQHQHLRVNDTLTLEVSRPLAFFTVWRAVEPAPALGRPGTRVLWGRAALRGRRGYYEVLDANAPYCTLYLAAVSRQGDVLALSCWSDIDRQAPLARAHLLDTVSVQRNQEFGYGYWDVRYRTWGLLLGADLQELPPPQEADEVYAFELSVVGFTGGTYRGRAYHLLPYWLAREQARVRRTRRLPTAPYLANFLDLAYEVRGGRLAPPYRPLLAHLLRAYAACPQPPATARQVLAARQALAARQP